jgi:hypothetical protein
MKNEVFSTVKLPAIVIGFRLAALGRVISGQKMGILSASLLCFAVTADAGITTNATNSQLFQFKFELNKPLLYAFEIKSKSAISQDIGGRNASSTTSSDVRYKIRLTAIKVNKDGTTTVHCEPIDYEQDIEIVGPSGIVTTTTRGLDIISKQNGITTIDTTNGIGLGQAKQFKLGVYPYLLSGYIDLNTQGAVAKLDGDLPFVDHWQEAIHPNRGFFQFIFPDNAIAIGRSWTNYIPCTSGNGVILNDTGVNQTNIFTRETDSAPESTTNNNPIACFSLYSVDDRKNLSGYLDQVGERTSLVVPERAENLNATLHFDQKQGCLINMSKTDKTAVFVNMMIRGNSAMGRTDTEINTTIKLVSPDNQ